MKQLKQPMRIRAFYPLIAGVLLALLVLLGALAWLLYDASEDFARLRERHAQIERTADELRQSSDDLTRYARLYAVSGKRNYLDIYNAIIRIRNGEQPRPQNYHRIYWDLQPQVRLERHPPGEARALRDTFAELMTAEEIGTIEESQKQSDHLAETTEARAFAKVADGDLQSAIQLLHSDDYRRRKHNIMLPLDKLAVQINHRLQRESDAFSRRVNILFLLLGITLIAGAGALHLIIRHSRERILKPLDLLARNILENKDARDGNFHNDEIGLLAQRFFQMKSSMEHNYRELENASYRDTLTGVFNRNYFFQQGDLALKRAVRDKQQLCIIMTDLDNFKMINDAHGHLAGDDALKHAAAIITGNIRETDIAARFGGEEFVVVLIKTQLSDAMAVAEKIRAGMESSPCESHGEQIKMTTSIGVAEVNEEDGGINTAIARADKALYAAKAAGRNCVKTASQS